MNKFPLLLALALATSARAQPLDQPMDRPTARENAPAAPLDLDALGSRPVPPGTIPPPQQERLRAIGRWLATNGEGPTPQGDAPVVITSLAPGPSNAPGGKVEKVEMLGVARPLEFTRDEKGLTVKMPTPAIRPCDFAYVIRITGLKLKPSSAPTP
jgi:hypothetical protein